MAFENDTVKPASPRSQLQDERRQKEFKDSAEPSMGALEVFVGKVEKVLFAKPETGFFVISAVLPKGALPPKVTVGGRPWLARQFTVMGVSKSFLERDRKGQEIECFGQWAVSEKHGVQFEARFVNEKLPSSPEAIESFLGSGRVRGLGPHYAKRVVEKFGTDTLRILDEEPKRLLEVPGIGEKRIETIQASWKTLRGVYNIMSFMQMHGIGDAIGMRIYNAFGDSAVRIIEQNPYALTRVPMVGFKTSDRIAKSLGVSALAPHRLDAALKFALDEAGKNEGHTALPFMDLASRAADLLEIELDPAKQAIECALHAGALKERMLTVKMAMREHWGEKLIEREERCVSHKGILAAEKKAAEDIRRLMESPRAWVMKDEILAAELTDQESALDASQRQAVINSFGEKLSVITGGPGTGKTHTIKAILRAAEKMGLKVALGAPTGRAAKRMEEATGNKASTLHRMLGFAPDQGFKFNEAARLDADLIVIDESSMMDIWLLTAFLRAVADGASVIFVGDVDQLPSVGAGNVLSDLITCSRLGVSRLENIHRQAAGSKIVTNAHKIIRKRYPELPDEESGADFVFIEAEGNELIQRAVADLARRLVAQGVEPSSIQAITPQKGTELGTVELNNALRPILNSGFKEEEVVQEDGARLKFAKGDRVMQFRNNYNLEIFNGDVGEVVDVNKETGAIVASFDGRELELSGSQLKDLQLAYAITIHKSQGTEHEHVILPMSRSHSFMFSPNLLYTAVTRGKTKVWLVGEKRVVFGAVRAQERQFRHTGLKEEIRQELKAKEQDAGLFQE